MPKFNTNNFFKALANACIGINELSEISGVSNTTLSRINAGGYKARPKTIGKIASALNVSIDYLIESKEECE